MILKKTNNLTVGTNHSYHLIDPSPWPLMSSSSVSMVTIGLVTWMQHFKGGWVLFLNGLFSLIYIVSIWWRDVIREATFEEQHKTSVRRGLRFGMFLKLCFFLLFFGGFFHSSLSPVYNIGGVWPPKAILPVSLGGIPLTNTFLLLSSGATMLL
jgi:hypothetical protein